MEAVKGKFAFKERPGKSAEYDWNKILNGKTWRLKEGEDFHCKKTTFGTLSRMSAKRRGLSVRMASEEGGVVIQAFGHDTPGHQEYLTTGKAPKGVESETENTTEETSMEEAVA